jgi:hypothetical protein
MTAINGAQCNVSGLAAKFESLGGAAGGGGWNFTCFFSSSTNYEASSTNSSVSYLHLKLRCAHAQGEATAIEI